MLLKHKILGVDITDEHIRLIQLTKDHTVRAYGTFDLPAGVVERGAIADRSQFVSLFREALSHTKPVSVSDPFVQPIASIALPESQIWSHTARIPREVPRSDISTYIADEAARILPVDTASLAYDVVTSDAHGEIYATFAGAAHDTIEAYASALQEAGVNPERIGSSFHALARAVLPRAFDNDNYLVIDLEPARTNIGAFDEHAVAYMVIESAAIPSEHQEQVFPAISDDVVRLRAHFEDATNEVITKIIVAGRHADVPSVAKNFADIFDVPVTTGDALRHVRNPELFDGVKMTTPYASAIGLSLATADPASLQLNFYRMHDAHNAKLMRGSLSGEGERLRVRLQKLWAQVRLNAKTGKGVHTNSTLYLVGAFCLAACALLLVVLFNYLL